MARTLMDTKVALSAHVWARLDLAYNLLKGWCACLCFEVHEE